MQTCGPNVLANIPRTVYLNVCTASAAYSELCNKEALSASVRHRLSMLAFVYVSMADRKTHADRDMCLDIVIPQLYLSMWRQRAAVAACASCYSVCVAELHRPQLRYGNRRHNLYVVLVTAAVMLSSFYFLKHLTESFPKGNASQTLSHITSSLMGLASWIRLIISKPDNSRTLMMSLWSLSVMVWFSWQILLPSLCFQFTTEPSSTSPTRWCTCPNSRTSSLKPLMRFLKQWWTRYVLFSWVTNSTKHKSCTVC